MIAFWIGGSRRLASETFGRRLAAMRKQRGLSQVELAAAIGRSRQAIRAWENNSNKEVCQSDVKKCALVLRCCTKDLLASLDEPISPAPSGWPRIRWRLKQRLAATGYRQASETPSNDGHDGLGMRKLGRLSWSPRLRLR
jgi:transcriptional regulator with XRE-family HTH domain